MRFILFVVFSLLSFTSPAMMVANPNSIVIVEFQHQFYQITLEETRKLDSIESFENRLIRSDDWSTVIQTGNVELASALVDKLYSYLPNDEFMPFLLLALSRNDDDSIYSVADRAYLVAENFLTPDELLKIRTHKSYMQNLSPQVQWKSLFRNYGNEIETLDQAVSYLRQESLIESDDDSKRRNAMAVIAQSKDLQELMSLMDDVDFDIAVSSWYGLSRLIPQKVAYEIVTDAIWRTDELKYNISSGCTVWSEMLTPSMAAYDLFSDYLSKNQLQEIMAQDPILNSKEYNKYSLMLVQSYKMAEALNNLIIPKRSIRNLDRFNFKTTVIQYSEEELKDLNSGVDMVNVSSNMQFTKNVYKYLLGRYQSGIDEEEYSIVMAAFRSKNKYAKKYLKYLVSDEVSMSQQAHNAEMLLANYGITGWPREWQELRNKAIEIYKNNLENDADQSFLSADSKLLLSL
jgi:hypothetical protein